MEHAWNADHVYAIQADSIRISLVAFRFSSILQKKPHGRLARLPRCVDSWRNANCSGRTTGRRFGNTTQFLNPQWNVAMFDSLKNFLAEFSGDTAKREFDEDDYRLA